MQGQRGHSKRARLVDELSHQIRSGQLPRGHRLDGEHQLAERYNVSRGTVRQALTTLQQERLITTESGVGSFVTFDGHPLSQREGWAKALSTTGATIRTEVVGIETVTAASVPLPPPGLDDAVGYVAVRRRRVLEGDETVLSYEVAVVPALGSLAQLPTRGLLDGSLSRSLAAEGLVAARGTQRVDIHTVTAKEVALLGRETGTAMLRSVRTSAASTGAFVEHVVSLLDADHFTLELTFEEPS